MPDAIHVPTPLIGGCAVCGANRCEHGFVDFGVASGLANRLIPQHSHFHLICDDCLMDAVRQSPRFQQVQDHYAELKQQVADLGAELDAAREEAASFANVIDLGVERARRKGKLPETTSA